MSDNAPPLLDAHKKEIAVGSRVRSGSDVGTVRRTEPAYGVMTIVIPDRNAKKELMVRASTVEVLPDEPAEVEAAAAAAQAAEHAPGHGGDGMYYRTWVWLLVITVLEVGVALVNVPRVMLITTLMVMSVLKAVLIMATFMHLRFERIQFIYTVVVPLFFGALLFFAVVPDALNNLTREPVQVSAGQPETPTVPAPGPGTPAPSQPGPSGPVVTTSTLEIVGKDNFYVPSEVTIKASQSYEFDFKNQGTTVHNLVITVSGQSLASDIAVNGGQDSKFTVKIDQPGKYPMSCTYHPEMTGVLTVVR